jgi:DNA invertase Pin-like site-specific DNA recombinase
MHKDRTRIGSQRAVRAREYRQWRMGDRLSEVDVARIVTAFTTGTSKRKLAERYGISESSVKRIIGQHGASKPSSGLPGAADGAHRVPIIVHEFASVATQA